MKRVWPFSFYFWQYAGIAFVSPFLVLYYQSLGFSGPQIGLLTGLSPLVTLVCTPLWTGLADATRQHRWVMRLALLGSILAALAFPFLRAFLPVLAFSAGYCVFNAPVSPLADSASMRLLAEDRDMYGRLRLGGTVGFALAAPIAGLLIQRYGLAAAFRGSAAMYVLALAVSQKLWPPVGPPVAQSVGQRRISVRGGSGALMTNPRWLLFLAGAFAGGIAMAASNNYYLPYLKELGANETTMGLALALGTVFEVPVLFFGHRLLKWLKAYPLFLWTLAITAARLLLMAAAGSVGLALLIQPLTGLTFPAMWMAGVAYADESAPPGLSATAQGLFGATVFGIGSAVGGFMGGPLLAGAGAHTLYLVFGLTVLIVTALVAVAGRWQMGKGKLF